MPFTLGDYIWIPGIREEIESKDSEIKAFAVHDGKLVPFTMTVGELTDDEREIILKGCLINYNRRNQ